MLFPRAQAEDRAELGLISGCRAELSLARGSLLLCSLEETLGLFSCVMVVPCQIGLCKHQVLQIMLSSLGHMEKWHLGCSYVAPIPVEMFLTD